MITPFRKTYSSPDAEEYRMVNAEMLCTSPDEGCIEDIEIEDFTL